MKNAIKNLKQTIHDLTAKKRETRENIKSLKTTPGGEHRPETGQERDLIWQRYQWPFRAQARAAHLAYGILRGKPYQLMEPETTRKGLYPAMVLSMILAAIPAEEKATSTEEWTLARIETLLTRQPAKVAA